MRYVAEPLLAGLHRGDAARLSVRALFPVLADAERRHGSVARAWRRMPADAGGSGSMSLRGGLAAIPAVMQSGRTAANLGCIGNRVYTGLADDELYFAISGPQVTAVVEKLATIVHANRELEKFHRGRMPTCLN